MMMDRICRGYLWILSGYHIFTGLISVFTPEFAMSFYKKFYDCNPVERKHVALMLKPWGALAVFAGIAGLFAAAAPYRYRGVVIGLVVLLAIRIYYRVAFRRWLQEISGIAPYHNAFNVALLIFGLVILAGWLITTGA